MKGCALGYPCSCPPELLAPEPIRQQHRAENCTCGLSEPEHTGHAPEHADFCDVTDEDY